MGVVMGDMADFALDSMIFDMAEDDAWRGLNTQCKFCLARGFQWIRTEKGWRLGTYDKGKEILHRCRAYESLK